MGEALALVSAVCFGLTHFISGVLARRVDGVLVALYAQAGGMALSLPMLWWPGGSVSLPAVGWGVLSGLGTAAGVGFLYKAMSRGAMSVAVPVSDLGAATLPVLVALLILTERPSPLALLGIAVALPAIFLVSRTKTEDGEQSRWAAGVGLALLAGVGFGTHFVAIAAIPAEAGLAPITVSRIVSVLALLPFIPFPKVRMPLKTAGVAVIAGSIGTLATLLYFVATQTQLVAIAAVLSALYPAIPVILALLILRERISRQQVAGLVCAGAAIALIAAS